jgi:hypothetical protein
MSVIHSPFIGIICRQVVISCRLWYISFMFVIEDFTLTEMRLVDVLCNFQRHFSYTVVVSFSDGEKRKKQLTCQKSHYHIKLQQVHFTMSRQRWCMDGHGLNFAHHWWCLILSKNFILFAYGNSSYWAKTKCMMYERSWVKLGIICPS